MNTRLRPPQLTLPVVFSPCGESFLGLYGRDMLHYLEINSIEARRVSQAI